MTLERADSDLAFSPFCVPCCDVTGDGGGLLLREADRQGGQDGEVWQSPTPRCWIVLVSQPPGVPGRPLSRL